MTSSTRAAGLYVSLVVPSLAQVEKYTGEWGLIVYALAVALAVRWWPRRRMQARTALSCAIVVTLAVVVLFLVAFPIANSGRFGPGSDTDEAYDLAVGALLDGRYPYDVETYLGNRVHHLPGALLLATPFVQLGSSAYQNLFWLPLFFVVAWRESGDAVEALSLYLTVLLLSPVVLHQIVTGGDGVTNGLAVLVTTWWVVRSERPRNRAIATVCLALAVSNRPNFFLALVPLVALIVRREGPTAGARWGAAMAALLAAINLPFLLYDPAGFSPLEGADRVSRFAGLVPYAGPVLAGAGAALALVLSLRVRSLTHVFASMALVQGFFVVTGILLSSVQAGQLDLAYAGYGPFFLFTGALAAWPWRHRVMTAMRSDAVVA